MSPMLLDVHPVYGAIYEDGEFVQRGAVLGLAADSKSVVVAPVSGWVRLQHETEDAQTRARLLVEILPTAENTIPH